jgi:hypothetical protein
MWIVCLRFTILTRMLQSRSDLTPKPLLGDKSSPQSEQRNWLRKLSIPAES